MMKRVREWLARLASPGPGDAPRARPEVDLDLAREEPGVDTANAIRGACDRRPGALEQALLGLCNARGTRAERALLDTVFACRERLPDELSRAASEILLERGEHAGVERLLAHLSDVESLSLLAEAYTARGELERARSALERVLAQDIDAPSARERHRALVRALGGTLAQDGSGHPTLLRAEPPTTSFCIVAEVARGGSGTIYEARDDVLGRTVALKVYHRPRLERERLEREARMAVELRGAGIVRLFDVVPRQGLITMEWIARGSLRQALHRGEPELSDVRRWFEPFVEAVARIHAAGIVHSDLKPDNVLMRSLTEPVVTDFGSAVPVGELALGGTLGYLPPERATRSTASFADDVYAVGRILEHALDRLPSPAGERQWRAALARMLAPLGSRPPDARELLRIIPPP
jgi:serine/threonine-protein kinase